MQIIRGLHNLKPLHKNTVLTIGNFDGLHLGHQQMLKQLNLQAFKLNCTSCLMSFEPLPTEFFARDKAPARLMNRTEKIAKLSCFSADIKPDFLLLLHFNHAFAKLSAVDFIEQILLEKLNIKALVVGDDFRFGCDRKGDFALLQHYSQRAGFVLTRINSHAIEQQRVSSSLIRQALANNQLALADKMLGFSYQICGIVNHGAKRGRTIGFPTANILLKRLQSPLKGVYSVTMHSKQYGEVVGIANIGNRPTVNGTKMQLEVHLFNFSHNLYGKHVCISFQKKIRDEVKFDSFEALKKQILIDCQLAQQ